MNKNNLSDAKKRLLEKYKKKTSFKKKDVLKIYKEITDIEDPLSNSRIKILKSIKTYFIDYIKKNGTEKEIKELEDEELFNKNLNNYIDIMYPTFKIAAIKYKDDNIK